MARLTEIVFDALSPARLARFWAAVLETYEVRAYDPAEAARLASLGYTPETDPSVAIDGAAQRSSSKRAIPRQRGAIEYTLTWTA